MSCFILLPLSKQMQEFETAKSAYTDLAICFNHQKSYFYTDQFRVTRTSWALQRIFKKNHYKLGFKNALWNMEDHVTKMTLRWVHVFLKVNSRTYNTSRSRKWTRRALNFQFSDHKEKRGASAMVMHSEVQWGPTFSGTTAYHRAFRLFQLTIKSLEAAVRDSVGIPWTHHLPGHSLHLHTKQFLLKSWDDTYHCFDLCFPDD